MIKFIRILFLSEMIIKEQMCQFASAKYGAIITDMKGSSGGSTFKGSKSGAVMQNKITSAPQGKSGGKITKADAGRVINTQRNQSISVQAWKDLSESDRASWSAGAVNFPFVNKFGQSYVASGYQLFISVNNNLLAVGQSPLSVCPAAGTIDPCPAFNVNYTAGGGGALDTDITVPAGYKAVIYASASQSAGRNLEEGKMKAIIILPSGTTGTTSLKSAYIAIFGSLPSSGNIWIVGKITKSDAGRQGLPYRVNVQW